MALVAVNLCLCAHNTRGAYTVQRYLLMLLVAAETVSRTCIATLLFLIANVSACFLPYSSSSVLQGWDTMRFYFEPEEATQVAKCLGIAYICHSAYFVTIDAVSMHVTIRVSELPAPC